MFNIVLVHPEIPPNTGNVIRLAANTGCRLHLVEPLGFSMEDRLLQRAGLDYHEYARVERHPDWAGTGSAPRNATAAACSPSPRAVRRCCTQIAWQPGDWLVFGSETAGLPVGLRDSFAPERRVRLPMRPDQRSLNLSNAVAVAVFDAWRCCGYEGAV